MKMHLIGLAAVAAFCGSLALAPAVQAADVVGTGTLTGDATGSGTKADGKTPDVGATRYAMKYDGPVEFTFDFSINPADTGFETADNFITFTTVYYSAKRGKNSVKVRKGDPGWSDFTTQKIPITGATFDKNNKVLTITFAGPWYPVADAAKYGLIDKGLTGSIDFTTGKANFTSSYEQGAGGPILTFVTTGTVPVPGGGGGMPEPSTWAMLLLGAFGLGLALRRRPRPQPALA